MTNKYYEGSDVGNMWNKINKQVIIITAVLCVCVISIFGTIESVKNNINKTAAKAIDSIQGKDNDYIALSDENVDSIFPQMISDSFDESTDSSSDYLSENDAIVCNRQIVVDPQTNVAVMSVLVPEGWSASCYVDWQTYVNEKMPGRAFVELRSPDNNICVQYVSSMFFVQYNSDRYVGNYHRSIENLMTELDYMNAQDYTQHMLDMSNISMKTSTEEYIDSARQNKIKNMAYEEGLKRCDYLDRMIGASYRNSSMGYSVNLTDYDGRTYIQHGISNINGKDCYTETICEEYMYETTETTTIGAELVGSFNFEAITKYWEPYLFTVASFSDEQTYIDNCDLYRFLISNMILCKDFLYLNQILGSQYVEMATKYNLEITNYAHEVMMQYQQETMQQEDAWVKNFSDYIYDQTTYTMSDGAEVAVPTSADYVYSDGNNVIWSNSAMYEPGPEYTRIN